MPGDGRGARGAASRRPGGNASARRRHKRVQILRSAAAAFRRRGFHGTSVDQIARDLHMSKGNLYYYFRDKEDLLFACNDYSLDVLLDVLRRIEAGRQPPDVQLRQLIGAFVGLIVDELHGTALTMDFEALSEPRLRHIIAKRDRVDRALRRMIERGMGEGSFAAGDPKLISFAMLGALNWIAQWFHPEGRAGSAEIAETFSTYLVEGLLTRRPTSGARRGPGPG